MEGDIFSWILLRFSLSQRSTSKGSYIKQRTINAMTSYCVDILFLLFLLLLMPLTKIFPEFLIPLYGCQLSIFIVLKDPVIEMVALTSFRRSISLGRSLNCASLISNSEIVWWFSSMLLTTISTNFNLVTNYRTFSWCKWGSYRLFSR